jgi:hypothetical protein
MDKQLSFKDLCARLPYKTMVKCNTDGRHEFDEELSVMHIMNFYQWEIKPYLRPMSSMTEEEKKELWELLKKLGMASDIKRLDWLNAHHFDYRGLIEKGLALEAPKGMYN